MHVQIIEISLERMDPDVTVSNAGKAGSNLPGLTFERSVIRV